MRSTFTMLAAVLAALGPRHLRAQQLGWHAAIDASGNMLFGNAQDRLCAGRLQVGRADSTLEVRSDARFTYAESTDDTGKRVVRGRTGVRWLNRWSLRARMRLHREVDDDGRREPNVEAVADVHRPRHVRQRVARPWRAKPTTTVSSSLV
jgi:hypothetical protein